MTSCSRLRYLEWPACTRPDLGQHAPPRTLVLLHAFPLGARMWDPQHALADHGWRVVMPQFRGFDCDQPDGPDASSIEDYAGDVADLLETLSIRTAVICGLSMGGYVAFELYRHAPALFRALILADTRAEADTPEGRAGRMTMIGLAAAKGAAGVAEEMVPKLLGETTRGTRADLVQRVRTLILANRPQPIQAATRSMMTRNQSVSLLPLIRVPTLVLVGEEDTLTPPAAASAMSDAIPGARLAVIARAGHLSSLEQPGSFNAEVLSFLGRL